MDKLAFAGTFKNKRLLVPEKEDERDRNRNIIRNRVKQTKEKPGVKFTDYFTG